MTDRASQPAGARRELRAALLGPVEISVDRRPLPVREWTRRAPRSLLLMLLGGAGNRVTRDLAIETIWPDLAPEAAANALYKAIHFLRRELDPKSPEAKGASAISLSADFIALSQDLDLWIDANAFERGIMTRSLNPDARRAALRQALQLYRDDFLIDEPWLDWPVPRRETLKSLRERAVLEVAALDRDAGQPLESVGLLEALIASDPLLEAAYQELMRAHLAAGDRESALRTFKRCETALETELGVKPDAGTLELLDAPAAVETGRRKRLPVAPAPLVGRERELDLIESLFNDPDVRVITLTGPGGVGKTRLAIEAGWTLDADFPDGALFVPLSASRDGDQLGYAVANALGVRPGNAHPDGGTIGAAIDGRPLLLILDNVEQVVEAAARFVSELLAASVGPKLLVTSRERLRIRGEREVMVPPFDPPDAGASASRIAGSDAGTLFARLVRAYDPDFAITEENAGLIARICGRLDGLPLSLELAASRARRMRLEALLDALEAPLRTLTGGDRDLPERHRTLRDAIAWSYDLLSDDEQRAFRALAVFAGGATPEALDAVSPGGGDPLDALADRSLAVWTDTVAGPRVSLLETIRAFAEAAAKVAGEWEGLRRAHAEWVADLARAAEAAYFGRDQLRWNDRLDLEMGNIRRAVEYAADTGDGARSATIVAGLIHYLLHRGHGQEGFHWAQRMARDAGLSERDAIRLLRVTSRLGFRVTEFAVVEAAWNEARERAEALGDPELLADLLSDLASIPWYRANSDATLPLLEQAYALHREAEDVPGQVYSLNGLGAIAMLDGDIARAKELDAEAVRLARRSGNPMIQLVSLSTQGIALAMNREFEAAKPVFEEGLELALESRDPLLELTFRHGLALIAYEDGDFDMAIAGYRQVVEMNRRIGHWQGVALALLELGRIETVRGNLEVAAGQIRTVLTEFVQGGHVRWAIATCDDAAALLAAAGDIAVAARLVGYGGVARAERGVARMAVDQPAFDRLNTALRTALDPVELERELAAGALLTDAEAWELAKAALDRIAGEDR